MIDETRARTPQWRLTAASRAAESPAGATRPVCPIRPPTPAEHTTNDVPSERRRRTTAEIMRRHVMSAREDTPAAFVLGILTRNHFSWLPIVDDEGRLVGLVTDHSLITSGWDPETAGADLAGKRARDLMVPVEAVVEEETPVQEVAELMRQLSVESLPVVRDGRIVGIVGRSELLEALAESLYEQEGWR